MRTDSDSRLLDEAAGLGVDAVKAVVGMLDRVAVLRNAAPPPRKNLLDASDTVVLYRWLRIAGRNYGGHLTLGQELNRRGLKARADSMIHNMLEAYR